MTVRPIHRDTFFTYVRRSPFGNRLSQQQVDGMEAILNFWDKFYRHLDDRFLAYILATAFHETGGLMVPVREGFAKTDAGARRAVANRKYAAEDPETGHAYYGRGLVQITWADNYKRLGGRINIDLYHDPDLALDLDVSVRLLVIGMVEGLYTKRSLFDYFNSGTDDPEGARRIINGTDKAKLIATYHHAFLDSIKAATAYQRPKDVAPVEPDGPKLSTDKTIIGALTAGGGGLVASALGAINNPWALAAFAVVAIGVFLVVTGRVEIKRKAGA